MEADLTRRWVNPDGTRGENHYRAPVEMAVGEMRATVYDVKAGEDRPIATVTMMGDEIDACLFGTLTSLSWIGANGSPPVFAERIRNGRLEGKEMVMGRECFKIVYEQEFLPERLEDEYFKRVDVYYVDAVTHFVLKWRSEEHNAVDSDPWMSSSRLYRNISTRMVTDPSVADVRN